MAYWLIKSEPGDWSWQDQCDVPFEPWTGVRNYQARKHLRAMAEGDLAFFYHSVDEKRIVGIVKVVRTAYPDPTDTSSSAGTPKGWDCVDVAAVGPLPEPVSLAQMKADPALQDLALLKQSRLSVVPLTEAEWIHICVLGAYSA